MKLYLSIISIAMTIISLINIAFGTAPWYYIIIAVVFCTALQFVLDGIIALLINSMPDRWFGVDNPCFNVSDREKRLYKKLKVRKWKDKVWELGGLGGFSKRNLNEPDNPDHIEKFIIECNKGVVVHRVSYLIGFLAMFTLKGAPRYTVAAPVATVNLFLNILPTIVLRYNTPSLQLLLKGLRKKQGNILIHK